MAEVIRHPKHFRIEVLIESDRDQEQLSMFVEGVLAQQQWHFKVKDLSLYEVTHMPSHAERARGE